MRLRLHHQYMILCRGRLDDGGEAKTWIVALVKEDKFFRKDGAVERSGTRKHLLTFDTW